MEKQTRTSTLRWALSVIAIAATIPYLALKAHWIAGGRAGLADPEFGHSTVMMALNAATAVMEVVAVLLALAFVMHWGRRIPAVLIVAPMWVATGLLGQILITLPIQLILMSPHATAATDIAEGPIEAWVFTMVYGSFSILGLSLIAGFALYARTRWGHAQRWQAPVGRSAHPGHTAGIALVLALALGVVAVAQLPSGDAAVRGIRAGELIISLIAVMAVLALRFGVAPRMPRWLPIGALFLASGAFASWGTYLLVVSIVPNDLTAPEDVTGGAVALYVTKIVTGVVCALVLRRACTPESTYKRPPKPAFSPRFS